MGFCKCWLTTVLCSLAIAASQGEDPPEPSKVPFDGVDPPEPSQFPFDVAHADGAETITMLNDEMSNFENQEVIEDLEEDFKVLTRDFMDTNPKKVNGQPIFEADMLLSPNQWRAVRERKGLASESSRWTEGDDGFPRVPYTFDDTRLNKEVIKKAMEHWMDHTCIKFEETTNTNQKYLRYIYGGGCYSYVGMQTWNGQPVSIGRNCDTLGIAAHEIGHAIGFMHEQSRPDRDENVVINYENIDDNMEGNFWKYSTNEVDSKNIPYDYSSDMHYGATGFSINGKTTIATLDPLAQGLIGQRSGLSHRDKHLANIMYKCIDKWMSKCGVSTNPCQNGGYYGAQCACVCPPGSSGSNCEEQTGTYYENLQNSCTEMLTEEGAVTSPNHPNRYPAGKCVKHILAPECHVPRLTFSYFRLYGKNRYCSNNQCCYFDALEIRTSNKNSGDVFCGTDITAGRTFTGTDREMILFFRTVSNYYKGWKAQLTFVKQEGCT